MYTPSPVNIKRSKGQNLARNALGAFWAFFLTLIPCALVLLLAPTDSHWLEESSRYTLMAFPTLALLAALVFPPLPARGVLGKFLYTFSFGFIFYVLLAPNPYQKHLSVLFVEGQTQLEISTIALVSFIWVLVYQRILLGVSNSAVNALWSVNLNTLNALLIHKSSSHTTESSELEGATLTALPGSELHELTLLTPLLRLFPYARLEDTTLILPSGLYISLKIYQAPGDTHLTPEHQNSLRDDSLSDSNNQEENQEEAHRINAVNESFSPNDQGLASLQEHLEQNKELDTAENTVLQDDLHSLDTPYSTAPLSNQPTITADTIYALLQLEYHRGLNPLKLFAPASPSPQAILDYLRQHGLDIQALDAQESMY